MVLSVSQILERLKTPRNSSAIQEAINHEDRVKFHTKSVNDKQYAPYYPKFLKWVKDEIKLPADKFKAFKGMCQFPLATTQLCNDIFTEYEKIFTAQDSFFDVEMLDDTLKADFKTYLDDNLKLHDYFKNKGFEEFKTQPSCIYVIDLAINQATQRPEPYRLTVDINQVVDIEIEKKVDGTKRIGLLIFKEGKDAYHCLDDGNFRMFRKNAGGEYILEIDEPHNLGYAPAKFLLESSLYSDYDESPVARKAALSDSIADLEYLLFFKTSLRCFETYGVWPIMTVPETKCTYVDKFHNRCNSGFISGIDDLGGRYERECPACSKNNIVGSGTVFTRPVPKSKEDAPQLVGAVEFASIDSEIYSKITEKIDYLERELFASNVGDTDTTITKEAVNEQQVQANFEGRKSKLSYVKKDFETTKKWTVDTIGRLRYADYYVGCTVNMGEQWLLLTAEQLTLQYSEKKKAGLPAYMISQAKQQLIQTEYRNNPTLRQRSQILELLEPWPDYSIAECTAYQLDLKFPDKFFLKLDFAKFVSKFELSNGDIVVWGSALSLDKKIEKLTQILLKYGEEESGRAKPLPEQQPGFGSKPAGSK